jgi:hypothetical protein
MHTVTKEIKYYGDICTLVVKYGVRYLEGNSAAYFTVTGNVWKTGRRDCETCGCIHAIILRAFPDLVDVVKYHGDAITGEPSHALENGFYFLSKQKGPSVFEYSNRVCANHFKVDIRNVPALRALTKEELSAWIDAQRGRWKKEAKALIKKYELCEGK